MDDLELVKMLDEIGQKITHEEVTFPISSGQTLIVLVHDLAYLACKKVETQEEAAGLSQANQRAFQVTFYLVPTDQVNKLPLGRAFPTS